jgi:hypothetical protein
VAVTDAEESNGTKATPPQEGGVLANLPRTRPQRASARRTAARASGSANGRAPQAKARAKSAKTEPKRTGGPARLKAPTKARSATVASNAARMETPGKGSAAGGTAGRTPASVGDSAASAKAKSPTPLKPRPSSTVRTERARAAKRPKKTPPRAIPELEPAPRQGFESEGERTEGSVQPPGGAELVASAAEIVGELAKAGVSAGERLLKDVFSRLPG